MSATLIQRPTIENTAITWLLGSAVLGLLVLRLATNLGRESPTAKCFRPCPLLSLEPSQNLTRQLPLRLWDFRQCIPDRSRTKAMLKAYLKFFFAVTHELLKKPKAQMSVNAFQINLLNIRLPFPSQKWRFMW